METTAVPSSAGENSGVHSTRWSDVIHRARGGCREAFDLLARGCWGYLVVAANEKLANDLRVKQAPSDLVQQTLMIGYANIQQFPGTSEQDLLRWLETILDHQALTAGRRYRGTQARNINREVSLELAGPDAGVDSATPSRIVAETEERKQFDSTLAELPEHYRTVIQLRLMKELTFDEIGKVMGKNGDATRKLWLSALRNLKQRMSKQNGSSVR